MYFWSVCTILGYGLPLLTVYPSVTQILSHNPKALLDTQSPTTREPVLGSTVMLL